MIQAWKIADLYEMAEFYEVAKPHVVAETWVVEKPYIGTTLDLGNGVIRTPVNIHTGQDRG